ncbi:hypothetical protein [Tenacibaculum sp. nBUS_03]|uniref:hypothetical protein n=1 Tax=Tenacibaculum sp. nBUS_03 TaxID=3395320 RepID=UPI003EBA7C33
MTVEEQIKIAHAFIKKGKNLVIKGEQMLKKLVDKSCRIVETPEPSSTEKTKKSKLSLEQKQKLLERL